MVKKKFFYNILYMLVAIMIIVNTGSVYMAQNSHACIAILSGLLVTCNLWFICLNRIKLSKKECCGAIIYLAVIACIFVAWRHVYPYGLYVFLLLFPNLWLFIKILKKRNALSRFLSIFIYVCLVIAIIALVYWWFGSVMNILQPTSRVPLPWGDVARYINSYSGLYFEAQRAALKVGTFEIGVRNCAIFSEAPICSYVFISAFVLNEFLNLKHKTILGVFFLLMILTSLSTTGILFISLILLHLIYDIKTNKSELKVLKVLACLIIAIIALTICQSLLSEKLLTNSGIVRVTMIQKEFSAFLNSPLVGHGFDTYTNGSSNSVTALLADGGILLWCIYYFPFLRIMLNSIKTRILNIILAAYVFVFAVTVVQYTPLCILFVLLTYTNIYKDDKYDFNNCSSIQ